MSEDDTSNKKQLDVRFFQISIKKKKRKIMNDIKNKWNYIYIYLAYVEEIDCAGAKFLYSGFSNFVSETGPDAMLLSNENFCRNKG